MTEKNWIGRYFGRSPEEPAALPGLQPRICQCPNVRCSCFMRHRRQAPTGRCANPTLVGGSDDEAARTNRCG
jgi:hypothetical protein